MKNNEINIKERIYDPKETKVARITKFCEDDKLYNENNNYHVRATHLAYAIGEIKVKDGKYLFVDTVSDKLDEYLYFTSLIDAQINLPEQYDKPFVYDDSSLYRYGIYNEVSKDELIDKITTKMKAHFNFQDEDEEYKKVKIK